ncbi:LGFP repeat protein [Segniliparus rotundus DSM 44985]|uniref:LGFP repeat protein n=1 Tax=Segniliparus rotundus (strain ATCC BAA-972 / CDC 1076 / CIP 108378 / DSM 44985 / JCM 13578) TaxID=640132 RepID=D6ZCZ6_SEGRD|nr:hypothetical protein [Segniliparus rotundus]ADG99183.1 LGFP repeat protein [Segniliparus rotundus DSM 44985]
MIKNTMTRKTVLRAVGAFAALAAGVGVVVGCSDNKQAADKASGAMTSATNALTSASSAVSSAGSSVSSVVSSALSSPTTIDAPGVGNVVLDGPIASAYAKAGGKEKLGLPTAQPEKVGDGTVQAFEHGNAIYWSKETGARLVRGEILKIYKAHGGPAGALGFPTADEAETAGGPHAAHGGWISEFQHGTVTWLNQGDGMFKGNVTQK